MTDLVKKQLKTTSLIILFLSLIALLVTPIIFYQSRIYPNTSIAQVELGNLTKPEAEVKLKNNLSEPKSITLVFVEEQNQQQFSIPSEKIRLSLDYEASINQVLANQTLKNFLELKSYELVVNYHQDELTKHLDTILAQVGTPPVYPSVLLESKKIIFQPGEVGFETNKDIVIKELQKKFAAGKLDKITIILSPVDPRLTAEQKQIFINKAEKLINKKIILEFNQQKYELNDTQIIKALSPNGIYEDRLQGFIQKITKDLDRDPQNPKFIYKDGRVQEFAPAKSGVKVQTEILLKNITDAINNLSSSAETSVNLVIPVSKTEPDFDTSEVNNLGINELIGRGHSNFRGSIPSRIYNIELAASRISGTLVKPGEVFSFNQAVGDISSLTGYKQAYVIKDGQTVLGDGGGVCQVSTTLFRAALDAGLPIVERRAHSYRVGYYEQGYPPGLDATIYAPTTDLKFKNNTPGHILIQAYPDTKNLELVFEIYGTSDGRVAKTSKPIISSSTPPPEDKYIDDPTLPAGEIKQIEYKAWGARVSFDYKVTKNGETIFEKTFYSNYKPWGAVYLRGTATQ